MHVRSRWLNELTGLFLAHKRARVLATLPATVALKDVLLCLFKKLRWFWVDVSAYKVL